MANYTLYATEYTNHTLLRTSSEQLVV